MKNELEKEKKIMLNAEKVMSGKRQGNPCAIQKEKSMKYKMHCKMLGNRIDLNDSTAN